VIASAIELVGKPVRCPACGGPATLKREGDHVSLECPSDHDPVRGVRLETALEGLREEEPAKP
jgi:hypothetical protein